MTNTKLALSLTLSFPCNGDWSSGIDYATILQAICCPLTPLACYTALLAVNLYFLTDIIVVAIDVSRYIHG